jgi:hypothetical protein
MACVVGLLVGILWFFFVFLPLDYIVVINDVDQNVWVKWRRGDQILHDRQLAPQESDRYPSDSKERVEMITTQIYANNQSQWIDLRIYNIPSRVYDATYKVSQLRSPQQAMVTNDMDDIDVRVTYLTGNDTLCEVRLMSGQSDSCPFHANQPVEQIFTLVCDKNTEKWSVPCYYTISNGTTNITYRVSQIRRLETEDCFLGEGMPC